MNFIQKQKRMENAQGRITYGVLQGEVEDGIKNINLVQLETFDYNDLEDRESKLYITRRHKGKDLLLALYITRYYEQDNHEITKHTMKIPINHECLPYLKQMIEEAMEEVNDQVT